MKILNCYIKIFLVLLFGISLKINAGDLSQEASDEEPEEAPWIDPDEEREIKVLPTQPIETEDGKEEKIGLTINIPILGPVTCYSEMDPKTGEEILRATVPGKSINLSPVPIYFDNFEIIIPTNKNPSINATALLFGKKAKVELIEAKKKTAFKEIPVKTKTGKQEEALVADLSLLKLRIIFEEKPSFTLFPGKSLDLNHLDLLLELDKKAPILETEINMFGQPIDVQFGFTKESAAVDFSIPSTAFSNIIPFIKNTPLANAHLKSIIISAKYLFAKKVAKADDKKEAKEQNMAKKESIEEIKKDAESTNIGSASNLALAFSAQADLSGILDADLKKYLNLNDLTVHATFSQKEGFHLESSVKDFSVPLIGAISAAKFIIDWSEKSEQPKKDEKEKTEEAKKEVKQIEDPEESKSKEVTDKDDNKKKGPKLTIGLIGNGAFNIPLSGFNQLKYELDARYAHNEFIFGGKLNESFAYSTIKIDAEAGFVANISKKSVTITGNTDINGLDLIAKLLIAPDEKTKEMGVSIAATAKATDWQPLAGVEGIDVIPKELRDITIKNLDANFIAEKKAGKKLTSNLVVKGIANILNIEVNAQVHFIKNDNKTGVFIKADIPDEKLPSVLEKMQIKDAAFLLSTIEFIDPETKTKYAKGLNLKGEFDFTDKLKPLGDLLHLKRLDIVGLLDPADIKKSKFSVKLPGTLNTGLHVVSFGPLSLELSGEPSFKLVSEVTVRPDKNQSLLFKGSGGITGAAIAMELNMLGLWTNPFNLISKDFSIGNGTMGFSLVTAPPYINGLKIGGETELSKSKGQDIKFALSIDLTNPTNIALLGQMDGKFTLEEFVNFIICKVIKQKMSVNNVPDIFMEDVKIHFAPAKVEIGALEIEQGITLKGLVTVLGKQVAVDFEVKQSGAKAQADMSPLELGPLKITSGITAKGEKRETKLGGPSIDIELSTAKQIFLISGMLDLEYIFSANADISVSRSGLDFNFETHIGPDKLQLFMAKVTGHSAGPLSNPDFNLHMEMEQHFVNFIKEHIISGLNSAQKEIQDKINEKIRDINSIDKQIEAAKAGIESAKKNVEEWKNEVKSLNEQISKKKKEIDYYKSKIAGGSIWGDIGDKFKRAGSTIGDIAHGFTIATGVLSKQAIENSKKLVKKGINAAEKQADKVVYSAKIIEIGSEIVVLEAAKGTALVTLKGFQEVLDKVAKPVAIGSLEASKRAAQGFLNGIKTSSIQILKAGEWTVKSLAEGFNVQKIVFDGSLQKIKNDGQLPGMLFEITILGKEKQVAYNFNFKDVTASASNLAKYIAKKLVPVI